MNWDEAWQVAADRAEELFDSRWQQLIDLRQPTHPQDLIKPWQRLVQRRLDASTDKYRYGKAITMLRQLRDAYQPSVTRPASKPTSTTCATGTTVRPRSSPSSTTPNP